GIFNIYCIAFLFILLSLSHFYLFYCFSFFQICSYRICCITRTIKISSCINIHANSHTTSSLQQQIIYQFLNSHSYCNYSSASSFYDFGSHISITLIMASSYYTTTSTSTPRSAFTLCLCLFLLVGMSSAQLTSNFYATSCPKALSTIKSAVTSAVSKQVRMAASLLRLHFHDCFVNGCDASVLLDDTATFTGEKTAGPNANSLIGFNVIDTAKSQVETLCPGVVSCADILAVAARDSVVALGGPSWNVLLGRRDSTTASASASNTNIPAPNLDLNGLISAFSKKGFSAKEMVALSGGHTIGQAKCSNFRTRVYNETNINTSYATSLKAKCPSTGGDNNLAPLDVTSSTAFDNAYFKNLQIQRGLLHSDQQLFSGGSTDAQVNTYASNSAAFFTDFANAMVKMGNLSPLTGTNGQIRTNCRKTN
ncbi:cationic peroxidase 1-like, partial [Cornus florida]|uniref:cationic peroxidase 1-like n=1 Tax=Cornus florida TaxID=4283 RepID=UPI002898E7B2